MTPRGLHKKSSYLPDYPQRATELQRLADEHNRGGQIALNEHRVCYAKRGERVGLSRSTRQLIRKMIGQVRFENLDSLARVSSILAAAHVATGVGCVVHTVCRKRL